jgi:drug/metabolite transporter (DMT)-like permease
MSGGMAVPYVWGLIFLNESFSWLRTVGLALVLLAIALTAFGDKREKIALTDVLMCVVVFFLNGFVSVTSKLHQINTKYEAVGTTDFLLITTLFSLTSSIVIKIWYAVKEKSEVGAEKTKAKFDRSLLLPLLLVPLYSAIGGASSYLQLLGATNLPSSVLYPMITGGTVVLSGVFALICFGEKPSRREWIGMGLCLVGTCLFL